ncbi:MAG: hypothetical protein AAGH82_09390 [Pseudomonadota bacterium]
MSTRHQFRHSDHQHTQICLSQVVNAQSIEELQSLYLKTQDQLACPSLELAEADATVELQIQVIMQIAQRHAASLVDVLAKLTVWKSENSEADTEHATPSDALIVSALQDLRKLLSCSDAAMEPAPANP